MIWVGWNNPSSPTKRTTTLPKPCPSHRKENCKKRKKQHQPNLWHQYRSGSGLQLVKEKEGEEDLGGTTPPLNNCTTTLNLNWFAPLLSQGKKRKKKEKKKARGNSSLSTPPRGAPRLSSPLPSPPLLPFPSLPLPTEPLTFWFTVVVWLLLLAVVVGGGEGRRGEERGGRKKCVMLFRRFDPRETAELRLFPFFYKKMI